MIEFEDLGKILYIRKLVNIPTNNRNFIFLIQYYFIFVAQHQFIIIRDYRILVSFFVFLESQNWHTLFPLLPAIILKNVN